MLALVALAACRSSGDVRDKDGSEPAELPEIQDPLPVQRKWSVNTGAGTDRSRPHFRLQAHEGLIWTADHKGQITAVNASSGRVERRLSTRSEEHTSELQSRGHLVCRLLLEKKKTRAVDHKH